MSEIQRLRDRVEQLEDLLGIGSAMTKQLSAAFGLTQCQAKMLGVLLSRSMATKDAMYFVLYGDRPESEQPLSESVIKKHFVKLRRRLEPKGVRIDAIYGQGWKLANEHKAKIRGMISQQETMQ